MYQSYRMALGALLLGYQMDILMVASASSLAYSEGGPLVKALLIGAFLCYSLSVLVVGRLNMSDNGEKSLLPVVGAILSVMAAIAIVGGITVNASKVGEKMNDIITYQSTVYSVSLVFALLSGGLLFFGRLRGPDPDIII